MNIGIYGGSFNPIHYGHLGISRWVLEHTDLDQLWLMPSPQNPLKQDSDLADANARLEAARTAVADLITEHPNLVGRLLVSDIEFSLPKPTYTAATLRALSAQYPDYTFSLLIGADNVACWDRWREHDWIASHYRILVFPRQGYPLETFQTSQTTQTSQTSQTLQTPERGFCPLSDAPLFPISSTSIRAENSKK